MPLSLLVLIALFAAVWLLLIRPQRQRRAKQQDELTNLRIGDEIVTAGGLYGHVEAIEHDEVRVEIAPGTVVRIAKRAIAGVMPDEDEEYEEDEDEEGKGEPAEQELPAAEEASSGSTRS
jgi:preprotein translocase subunit YajC